MVNVSLPLLALAMAATAATLPAVTSATTFSFSQWVEDLIAHPETALSPEEAVAAANAATVVATSAGLIKRVPTCQEGIFESAPATDAAACLQDLARKGGQGVNCAIGEKQFDIQMCRIGHAEIVGSKSTSTFQQANCNDIARTGGLIFDTCWRADNTVKGTELCITNRLIAVNINRA